MFNNSLGFEQGPIRPPDEARSLLIRTTRSCPWNRCSFCTLFKGCGFSVRKVDEIKADIYKARDYYKGYKFEECFLQDGDSFIMKTRDLVDVLSTLKTVFPELKQISSYGRSQTMARKSLSEMKEIADAGLNMLYSGMESGSNKVLKIQNKGTTAEEIISSSQYAQEAGMSTRLFLILGLGGKEHSEDHVKETIRVLNLINPKDIRVLSLAVKDGTDLQAMVKNRSFTMLSEAEMIEEQREIVSGLDKVNSKYGNYHAVNLLQEIDGYLPENRDRLLKIMDDYLKLPEHKQLIYTYGRRFGYCRSIGDLEKRDLYSKIESELNEHMMNGYSPEDLFHSVRQRWI